MKSLFNIIEIYLENPSDKDMERVLERESTKNNTVKMYEKIYDLERQLEEAKEDIETYKYDFETLVSILHDCLHNMSQEECLDTLRQVDEHYEHLKEKGESED